jgi:TraY domain
MKEEKRGRGRPTIGERVPLSLRVTPQMKARLDEAAQESGRSQSQEAEIRLERSFVHGDLLGDVLSLAFGAQFAGLLFLLGIAMIDQGRRMTEGKGDWTSDSVAYDAAMSAAVRLLEYCRPDGSRASDSDRDVAVQWVDELIKDLKSGRANEVLGRWRTDAIIALIDPIVTSMNKKLKRDARASRTSSKKMREVR